VDVGWEDVEEEEGQPLPWAAAPYYYSSSGPRPLLAATEVALQLARCPVATNGGGSMGMSSYSVLVALLDSRYTGLAELMKKALLLQALEVEVKGKMVSAICC
jgi:hypothetical protein